MKKGFPRPKGFVERTSRHPSKGSYGKKWNNKWYPWPYSASATTISNISSRMKQCVQFKLCGTCGDPVEEEVVGLILFNPASPYVRKGDMGEADDGLINAETGPYHLKCLVLNFNMCPHLVETKQFMPGYGEWKVVRPLVMAFYE